MHIYSENTLLYIESLPKEKVIYIPSKTGSVTIEVSGYSGRIINSPCRNQICLRQGIVRAGGYPAVCLPERVLMEIVECRGEFDALTH